MTKSSCTCHHLATQYFSSYSRLKEARQTIIFHAQLTFGPHAYASGIAPFSLNMQQKGLSNIVSFWNPDWSLAAFAS